MFRFVFAALCVACGFRLYLNDWPENECFMTYMFNAPRFRVIKINDDYKQLCRNYKLVYYTENNHREPADKVGSIPVLFIPGSQGNAKEVRSLASVALQMSLSRSTNFSFDYFALDFNEGFSALSAAMVEMQTDCAALALSAIQRLYLKSHRRAPQILVIGHSMGGLVAHNLLTRKDSDPSLVHTVVTLASPLAFPVLGVGSEILDIYLRVRSFWCALNTSPKFDHLAFLSITGGPRDLQPRSVVHLCNFLAAVQPKVWDGLGDASHWLPSTHFLHLTTSTVSGVWVTCDHLCIMWCKQLVLALNRAFFDMVDPKTLMPLSSRETRMGVIRSHLVSQPISFDSTPADESINSEPLKDFANCVWAYQVGMKTVVYDAPRTSHCTLLKLGPISQSDGEKILLYPFQMEIEDVFVCKNDSSPSTSPCLLYRLPAGSMRTTKVPGIDEFSARPRQLLTVSVDGQSFKNGFLILRLSHYGPASLLYESVPAARIDISRTLPLPNWYPFNSPILLNRTQSPDCHSATSCSQTPLPVFLRFHLRASNFAHGPTFPSPVLSISMSNCNASLGQFGLATVYFPWDNQVYHMKLRKNAENKIVLRSLSPQKFHPELSDPYVDVILEPTCQSTDVTVYYSFSQWLCQILRAHMMHAAASLFTGHLLLSLLLEVASPFVCTRTRDDRLSRSHPLHSCASSGFFAVNRRLRASPKNLCAILSLSKKRFAFLLEAIFFHALCAVLICCLCTAYFILLSSESNWLDTTWCHLVVCNWNHSSTLHTRLYTILPIYVIHLLFAVAVPTVVQVLADSCLGLPLLLRLSSLVCRRQKSASRSLSVAPSNSLLLLLFACSLLFHDGLAHLLLSIWVFSRCLTLSARRKPTTYVQDTGLRNTHELIAPSDAGRSWSLRVLRRLCLLFLFFSLLNIQQWIDFITQLTTSPFGSLISRPLALTPFRVSCVLLLLLRCLFGRVSLLANAPSFSCFYALSFTLSLTVLAGAAGTLHRFDACIYFGLAAILSLYCGLTKYSGPPSASLCFIRRLSLSSWRFNGWVIKPSCGRPKEASRRV